MHINLRVPLAHISPKLHNFEVDISHVLANVEYSPKSVRFQFLNNGIANAGINSALMQL